MVKAKKAPKKRVVKKKIKILPKKMSALIKISLADIRKAERHPDFVVNMGTWYEKKRLICSAGYFVISDRDICITCAAGSVMAFSLGAKIPIGEQHLYPQDMEKNTKQLEAIDCLRKGNVASAASYLNIPNKGCWEYNCVIPSYDYCNPEPFHEAMLRLQKCLEKAGL